MCSERKTPWEGRTSWEWGCGSLTRKESLASSAEVHVAAWGWPGLSFAARKRLCDPRDGLKVKGGHLRELMRDKLCF